MTSITLYRGIKNNEFLFLNTSRYTKLQNQWKKIISYKLEHNSYPEDMNSEIIELHKENKLCTQDFTDNLEIAKQYSDGKIISITVPLEDLCNYFTADFQNFKDRKNNFEIVYTVRGVDLFKKHIDWKFKLVQ